MIPKPPFLRDLTPEAEIAEFERLKPRLDALWDVNGFLVLILAFTARRH